jgi:hypothetical protein
LTLRPLTPPSSRPRPRPQLDNFPHRLVVLLPPSPTQYASLHRLAPRPYTRKLIGMVHGGWAGCGASPQKG